MSHAEAFKEFYKRCKGLRSFCLFFRRTPLKQALSGVWDVDSLDWKDYGTEAIIKEILENKHLGNGSIILCHNGAKYTKEALTAVIKGLKEKGFQLVTVSELIYTEEYTLDQEGRQHKKRGQ